MSGGIVEAIDGSCAGSGQRRVQKRRQRPDNDPGGESELSEGTF